MEASLYHLNIGYNFHVLIINKLYSEAGSFQRRQPLEDADS